MSTTLNSARATASRIAEGGLQAADEIRRTLERIHASQPSVGAFTACLELPAALQQLDAMQAAGIGPLQGVAVGVKDIFDTRDLPTVYGSALYTGPARSDAAMVSAIRRAGGLVIGKTTTTEFAFLNPTATRNPRVAGHTPGGSSAGSAAAVAAGLVPLAIGTQTGGSIVRPASYCGVVGFKPSFGLLPTPGFKCFSWSLDTVGLFANSVDDVAWFAEAVSGHALARDGHGTPHARTKPWTIGVPDAYPWGDVTPSARKALDDGCRALEAAGAKVHRITLPGWMRDVFEAQDVIQGYEVWRALSREVDEHADALSPILRDYLLAARHITPQAYEAAHRVAIQARHDLLAWMAPWDALMTPSAPDEAPAGYGSTGASSFNRAWTLLGVPSINVPGALGVNGLPMGLQVITGPRTDAACLQVAAFVEAALQRSR